jgi:uncharacterized protein (DUF1501 family)
MGLSALGTLPKGLLPRAYGAPTGNPFFVVLNCFGGYDGLSLVIPTGVSEYYTRRFMDPVTGTPTGPVSIAVPPGTELSLAGGPGGAGTSGYGLHPALPRIQAMWNAGNVAFIHDVGYPQDNLSHFESEDIFSQAVRYEFEDLGIAPSGWIARYADRWAPTPLGAVGVGVGRRLDFEGGSSNPLLVDSLASFQFLSDPGAAANHLYRLQVIRDVLAGYSGTGVDQEVAEAIEQGHALADEIQAAVSGYTSTVLYRASNGVTYNIHRTMQDVARLVQYGFETKIFYTGFGGFDTHGNQAPTMTALLDRLDTAVDAFRQDCVAMGIWDRVVILVVSEFGRRNFQNGSGGTDHGHDNVFLAIGGGVTGGHYGRQLSSLDLQKDWTGQGNTNTDHGVDFRDVYRAILEGHLGADPDELNEFVFPEPQPKSTTLGFAG